jgi:nicotinamide-nucleotide amidase
MRGELIFVGTELLLGQVINTNAAYLGQNLASLGVDLYHSNVVGDNLDRIKGAIQTALDRADLVLVTGGLGPTFDDITREGIAAAIGREMVYNPQVMAQIEKHFKRVKHPILPIHRRQAYVLSSGCQVVPNPIGSAPGLIIKAGGKWIIAMPGVPREMKRMCEDTIFAWVAEKAGKSVIKSKVLKVCGMGESMVANELQEIIKPLTNPTIAFLAQPSEVSVRITAKASDSDEANRMITVVADQIRGKLGENICAEDDQTMEQVVGSLLSECQSTLAIAESCTGGLISDRITDVPGSSDYFQGTVVAYSNQLKIDLLNVSKEDLDRHGAVSSPVAIQMAQGVRSLAKADYGLGITGIAGPTGATPQKPVGLVYAALASQHGAYGKEFRFVGDRSIIKRRASQMALDMLRRELLKSQNVNRE